MTTHHAAPQRAPARWRVLPLAMLLLTVLLLAGAACAGEGIGTATPTPDAGTTQAGALPATAPASGLATSTSSTAAVASSTTSTSTGPRQPIVLGFAGDTTFTNGLETRDPLGAVRDLLSAPDLMMVNLETAVADPDVGRVAVDKPFLFKSPPVALDLLVDAGIDAVGLANNHTLDFGPEALAQTIAEVDAAGLHRVGAGNDETEAYRPLVVEVGEWRVGLVALSRVPCDWSSAGDNVRPQVAWACDPFLDRVDAMVGATVEDADVTVAVVHGGAEGVLCPSDFMVEITERLAGLGVDAVVNGHPHVVQGIASAGAAIVVRSSGNFAFPAANGITGNSAIFLLDVSEGADGRPTLDLRIEPVRSESGVVRPPTESERTAILEQIGQHSSGWTIAADGTARVDAEQRGRCDEH